MINNRGLFNPPIIHVAVADVEATYGAYVAAENNTFNNYSNSSSDKNVKNRRKSVFRHHRSFNPMKNYDFSIFSIEI